MAPTAASPAWSRKRSTSPSGAPPRRRCASRRSWRRWASSPAAWPTTSTTCWRRSWPRWTWPPIPRPTPSAAPAPGRWRSSPPSAARAWGRARTVAVAQQSAERAAMLVQRLLAFARKQPLQTVEVDVPALLEGIGGLMRSSFDPRIRVEVDADPGTPPAVGDRNQLEMALLNLGVNARDAMSEGGTLTLASRGAEIVDGIASSTLRPGQYAVITVADTGVCMDAAT